jgi:competence protein ComEA
MFDLKLTKEQQLMVLGLLLTFIVGLSVTAYRAFFPPKDELVIEKPVANEPAVQVVNAFALVHLTGAVKRVGVYRLPIGERVIDLIKLAGGETKDADLSAVNLAEQVKDGMKVVIPTTVAEEKRSANGLINLNNADVEALDSLPGIGKTTAQKIIDYRQTNGPFTKIEQIMEIPRFGKSKFEKIKERLVI